MLICVLTVLWSIAWNYLYEESMKRITVLVAEGNRIVRERLRQRLELDGSVEVVGEAEDGYRAVALAKELATDLVFMDIAMPLLGGLEAAGRLLEAFPATKVLISSSHNDSADTQSASGSDVVAFLLKQISIRDICRSIPGPQKGNRTYRSVISKRFHRSNTQSHPPAGLLDRKVPHLTAREVEVLQLIANGNANKESAVKLGICIKTVEKHREHLMEKLNIHETAAVCHGGGNHRELVARIHPISMG